MVIIPRMAEPGVHLLVASFNHVGIEARVTDISDNRTLELGAQYTSGDECLPARITLGDFMKVLKDTNTNLSRLVLFMPLADGPCRFGQYAPYLRQVLDKIGYTQVKILSPSTEDGYIGLGKEIATKFMRTAWRGAIVADILQKLLLMYRPYELIPNDTETTYNYCVDYMCKTIVDSSQKSGEQLNEIRNALIVCRDHFRDTRITNRDRPIVGIVGEIYCRMNTFSNQDTIKVLESLGCEVWLCGFREWVQYVNEMELQCLRLKGKLCSWRAFISCLRTYFQGYDESRLFSVVAADFKDRKDPHISKVLKSAEPYLPASGASGEMVLNVGNVVCLADEGVSGIIDISPFTCMNGIVSEAMYPRISKDLGGLPIRSLYFDGAPVDLEAELGVFVEMVKRFKGLKEKEIKI
jgi:predicted nucleotide-binding protein (sugar kinase/HSP70/actin superfamily)